ncbi:MAG: metal ABC transporter permease [Planctomycetota bacterium]
MSTFITVDLLPLLVGTLAAVSCGLLGNFLVLRRISLMGDAISHAVLPGLAFAFLLTGLRSPLLMLAGAAASGVATVVLVELVKRLGRVEPGAAMGVVFSVLFALGVILIERAARNVDLDAECVLYGDLDAISLYWTDPGLGVSSLLAMPRQLWTLLITLSVVIVFVWVMFKELRIVSFDPALATAQGFNAPFVHYLLMVLVAAATVASFEAVGSILVIAMLICPAATARLLTDRLASQLWVSVGIAVVSGVGGYFAATQLPHAFGMRSVNAAGSIAVVGGLLLAIAMLFAPTHGIFARKLRRRRLAMTVAADDLVGALYRLSETGEPRSTREELAAMLPGRLVTRAIDRASAAGHIELEGDAVSLTNAGLDAGAQLVRRHRLWESYLVTEAGLGPDHVHDTAEQLEHFGITPTGGGVDPHGRPIPTAPEQQN